MSKYLSIILLTFLAYTVSAQKKDSLFVISKDEGWYIRHLVKKGETIKTIAERYHVIPAVLANTNNITHFDSLKVKQRLYIPLGTHNMLKAPPLNPNEAAPLYYKTDELDNLQRVSRRAGVTQVTLQAWNNMPGNVIKPGMRLKVGWVLYTMPSEISIAPPQVIAPVTGTMAAATPPVSATSKPDSAISILEQVYNYQSSDGQFINQVSGTVVFFKSQATLSDNTLYGFSNTIPKGRVVKIVNTSNGKYVFVKILGNLPTTKLYHNAMLGVDSRAKEELEIIEDKFWCDINYGG